MKTNFLLPRKQLLSAVCAGVLGLCGCATVGEKFNVWLASNADAVAVVDGRILRGQASFTREREATVLLKSSAEPSLSCFGPLRFNASRNGWVDFACSNGLSVVVAFRALTPLSGEGRGLLGKSEFSFTYGLGPEQAAAYLEVPLDRLVEPQEKERAPVPRE